MNKHEIAVKIARTIMEVGSEPFSPCKRIQFMGGTYPDNEKPQGGLCEIALKNTIYRVLAQIDNPEG